MEIKLNAGDRLNIPANCKATIEDNQIIIEEQKEVFKDGDILHSNMTGRVVIFKSYEDESCRVFCTYYNSANTSNNGWSADCFYHATEEEKQAFFDDLKAKGLRWNAKTKTMEKIRERAKIGEKYLTINEFGVVKELREERCTFDNKKFNSGNYYLLSKREQAEEDAKAIRAISEKRLKM